MWDRTGLHRPRPGAKEGLWTKAGGPRAFPRDPRRDGDGGDAASRLLPRFHRALPSAQGGRQPCAYPPPIRVRAFSGAGDPACCLRGGEGRVRGEPRPGIRGNPETGIDPVAADRRANGKAHPAREAVWGEEGNGAPRPFPLNSGKTAIAEVGRACRPFFPEWVEMFDAYSPSTLKTQA